MPGKSIAMKHKILIIEDEEALSMVLKDRFEDEDFEVVLANDGEKALATALDEKPDIILLDIVMPKLDGLSMLKELRNHEAGKTVPVMVLTNLSDTESVKEALAHGAYDILVKADWSVNDIIKSVKERLGKAGK
jgi:DNA-binding response OmpR family regulator